MRRDIDPANSSAPLVVVTEAKGACGHLEEFKYVSPPFSGQQFRVQPGGVGFRVSPTN